MKLSTIICAAFAFMGNAGAAFPQENYHSAHAILPWCKAALLDTPTGADGAFCLGAIVMARELVEGLLPPLRSCPPIAATNDQVIIVVVRFLRKSPGKATREFCGLDH